MSTIGTNWRVGRIARLVRSPAIGQRPAGIKPSSPSTPYVLLWSTGVVAVVLGVAALLLWGLNGAATLLDMIVAFCM
jgi:hypothetical protein